MTRFCIRCNRIIGENCVQCGTKVTASSNSHAVSSAEFDCPSCGHHFLQGDGGETGGMREPCFDAELHKAHGRWRRAESSAQVWDWEPGNRRLANDPSDFGLWQTQIQGRFREVVILLSMAGKLATRTAKR